MEPVLKLTIILYLIILICHRGHTILRESKLVPEKDARSLKEAIGIDEDNYLTFQELTSKYEFPSEKHKVVTEDKYILTVFRILPKCNGSIKKYPVLMSHGMLDSSDTWIINGPKAGLGYILASNCYDVWLTNRRGNSYSREHVTLNPDTDDEYWNFSFDESGNYDLPAVIDYILNVAKIDKVNFIGHSQGTTDFFAMASLRPDYNKKIVLGIEIAPVAWMREPFNPFFKLLGPITPNIKQILDAIGVKEMHNKLGLNHLATEVICYLAPGPSCEAMVYLLTGSKNFMPNSKLHIIFGHTYEGISTQAVAHYGQLIKTKKFRRYDEGRERNMQRYGTPVPPSYNISQITAPIVLIVSKSDWISSIGDVKFLSSKLPHVVETYIMPDSQWGHIDYLWADTAPKIFYPKLLNYLNKFNL